MFHETQREMKNNNNNVELKNSYGYRNIQTESTEIKDKRNADHRLRPYHHSLSHIH